jgi:glycosyltransferase involved in cell wall biosynthesis
MVATQPIAEDHYDLILPIAGGGVLGDELSTCIRLLGLEGNVRRLGFVPDRDLPTAYRAANLTVVPSVALEGFGSIVAESLAAGTPALEIPVGGLPEAACDLLSVLVLPATGAGPLSEGLVAALTGGLPLPSAEACQASASERYAWPLVAARVRGGYSGAPR